MPQELELIGEATKAASTTFSFINFALLSFAIAIIFSVIWLVLIMRVSDIKLKLWTFRGNNFIYKGEYNIKIKGKGTNEKWTIKGLNIVTSPIDSKYIYSGQKGGGIINLCLGDGGSLHPIQFVQDDNGIPFMQLQEHDVKFWYINEIREKEEFRKVNRQWEKLLPIGAIIILAIIFIFFMIYATKSVAENVGSIIAQGDRMAEDNKELARIMQNTANILTGNTQTRVVDPTGNLDGFT